MSDKLKKLTGKNPKDFEPVAYNLVNNNDVELFAQLVEKEDFLFDFVKQNVANRLEKVCNENNYLNLLNFLKYYSPSYEDFIVSTLAKYEATENMLQIFKNGSIAEKTYCAKYFSIVKDMNALGFLRENAYSQDSYLSANCVSALAQYGDRKIFDEAIEKLSSNDDFEKLEAVKILVSYQDKGALPKIIATMKKSPMAENIASEIPYLCDLFEILDNDRLNALYILNLIIDGLGETVALSQIFDFQLYSVFEILMNNQIDSSATVVLLNAKQKFETLTENDEYLYDESKDVKQEITDIKNLLRHFCANPDNELKPDSLFVFTALELTHNSNKVRELLNCDNQTIILKALEVLKRLNHLTVSDKNTALENVTDENIINIIMAI